VLSPMAQVKDGKKGLKRGRGGGREGGGTSELHTKKVYPSNVLLYRGGVHEGRKGAGKEGKEKRKQGMWLVREYLPILKTKLYVARTTCKKDSKRAGGPKNTNGWFQMCSSGSPESSLWEARGSIL